MEFKVTNRLTAEQQGAATELISNCQQYDQLFDMPYLANTFNLYPDMPAFILAYQDQDLIGFASLYAATDFDVNVMIYVAPSQRRQGIGRGLFEQAKIICRTYGYVEMIIQTEQQQLVKMPWLDAKFKLQHATDMAETLMQWCIKNSAQNRESKLAMAVTVRQLTPDDINVLAQIHAAGFDDEFADVTNDLQATFGDPNLKVYVFELKQQIIGSVTIELATPTTGYLFGYVIKKQLQGKGYGQQALAQVMQLIEIQGLKTISLAVDKKNVRAQYIYQKYGFVCQTTLEYLVGMV